MWLVQAMLTTIYFRINHFISCTSQLAAEARSYKHDHITLITATVIPYCLRHL